MNLKDKLLAFDTESTGLNVYADSQPARPFAFSFSDSGFETAYVRFQVNPKNRGVNYFESFLSISRLEWLKRVLEDPTTAKIGHNIGFDIRMARSIGIEVKGEIHDTLIMAHIFTGGSLLSYGLKELGIRIAEFPDDDEKDLKEATRKARTAGKKLGWSLATKELHGREPIKADYWMAPDELCKTYAIQDAQRTMLFFQAWYGKIMNDPNMKRVYEREMALARVVSKMENRGTRFLPERAAELRKFYGKYRDENLTIADANGGKGLNFRSPTQMVKKFIDEKGYEPIYYTRKGNPQINGDSLKFWAENKGDKLAKAILESKGALHMISGFLDPYERFKVKENDTTWVLHPNYRQCGPITGRFSCIAKGTKVEVVGSCGTTNIEDAKVGDYVYTYGPGGLNLKIQKVLRVINNGIRKVVRINWQGSGHRHKGFLDLTPEHRVMKTDGTWCKAIDLKPKDRVKALRRCSGIRQRLFATGYDTEISEQRFVCNYFHGLKDHVHHKDENKSNNHPDNLEPLTYKEHAAKHPRSEKHRKESSERLSKYNRENPKFGKENGNWRGGKGVAKYNHEVVSVEVLKKEVEVYDLSIERDHNFIAGELCVHNCGDPNLMQVASSTTGRRRTEITLRPREAFGPRDGYVWYLPDYSQIEVWVFSFLAKEQAMCEALLAGRDFHGAVAEKVWGKNPTFQSDHSYFRKRAKLLMFCKLYGGGVNKVAYLTDSTPEDAGIFVDEFDRQLPGISTYMKRMTNKAEREGKIVNPLGRTYYIDPDFCYRAVNYMVQGTSADILKNAMININKLFETKWHDCHILLTLHDELVMEIPLKYHSKKLMREIIVEMQRDSAEVGIPVPLPVGMKIAKRRWSDTIEIESLIQEWKDKYICKKTS